MRVLLRMAYLFIYRGSASIVLKNLDCFPDRFVLFSKLAGGITKRLNLRKRHHFPHGSFASCIGKPGAFPYILVLGHGLLNSTLLMRDHLHISAQVCRRKVALSKRGAGKKQAQQKQCSFHRIHLRNLKEPVNHPCAGLTARTPTQQRESTFKTPGFRHFYRLGGVPGRGQTEDSGGAVHELLCGSTRTYCKLNAKVGTAGAPFAGCRWLARQFFAHFWTLPPQ